MKRAYLHVNLDLVREAAGLPETVTITHVEMMPGFKADARVARVTLEGDGLPGAEITYEGEAPASIDAVYERLPAPEPAIPGALASARFKEFTR